MRYFAFKVGAAKDLGAAIGVAINGINIQVKFIKGISLHCQGPNDAGDVSIDEGGFQLACGGHVTPPTTNLVSMMMMMVMVMAMMVRMMVV